MTTRTTDELLTQFHHNQCLWLARLATGELYPRIPNRRLMETQGTLTVLPGRSGVVMLPKYGSAEQQLAGHNESLMWLRQARARDVLTWNMVQDADVDLALLAQGYRVGFEPWWMSRDLDDPIAQPQHIIRLATSADIDRLTETDVPYLIKEQIPAMKSLLRQPGEAQVVWLVAHHDQQLLGHAIVNMCEDHAGLFNVGVSGRHRNRGIGTSLTLAAMRFARQLGATTMNLNSTPLGKGVYERAGFLRIGTGHTWNRHGPSVFRDASIEEQRVALAVGRGDIRNLGDTLYFNQLASGLSLQELAARFNQPEMLLHLIERGHTPDIISMWRVGLRDEALAATNDADARELITGTQRANPIHHAVEMGAGTLVIALIEAGADLKARDGEFRATPLDWAHATNKPTIARIIHRAGGR